VRIHAYSGIETLDEWPAVKAWAERIAARAPAEAGTKIPA
jgi:glutathione S-transferase